MRAKHVGKVGQPARQRSIEERLSSLVTRIEVRAVRDEELDHLFRARKLGMQVEHQRVAFRVGRDRQ